MATNDLVTLSLEGDVPLPKYAEALVKFTTLIQSLSRDVAPNTQIRWIISYLAASSAITQARGVPDAEEAFPAVERTAAAYVDIGRSVSRGVTSPYSPDSEKAGRELAALVDGDIRTMRFENVLEDVIVQLGEHGKLTEAKAVLTAGAVEGRVETLSSRGGLRFMLYDLRNDKAISCYLAEGQEDAMRDAWGQTVIVEGIVNRDAESGRPLTVRQVRSIQILPEYVPGSYRQAGGVLRRRQGQPRAEELIRQIRDA